MQTENVKKFSDGERLEKLKREHRYTWAEIARDIGVSTSMIHMVRRGEKRLGREPCARLDLIESAMLAPLGNQGSHPGAPEPAAVREPGIAYGHETLGHIVWLEDQLSYARVKEERLLKIIEALAGIGEGHAHDPSAPPPAARASGAGGGEGRTERRAEA